MRNMRRESRSGVVLFFLKSKFMAGSYLSAKTAKKL